MQYETTKHVSGTLHRSDFNPLVTTLIIWMSPLSVLVASGVIFHFYFIFVEFLRANRIAPDGTPRFAASHLGQLCLPMSHKKDARLIWVNSDAPCGAVMLMHAFLFKILFIIGRLNRHREFFGT